MGTQESRFRLLKPPAHLHHFFFHRELSCSLIFVPIDLDPRSGQKNVSIDKNSKSESLSVPLITLAQSSTRKLSRIHKMDVTNTTSTPSKTSSPTGTTSSSSSASTPSSSPTTTTLSSSWSGHLSSILAKVNDMTHEKHGESKVLETLKDSLEKMRDEFASIEYKVESITEIAIEMLSKVENKYQKPADSGVGSGIAGEAAVKCPENYNVEVAGILYEFLDVLAAEVVFGKAARIFTDVGHAFAEMKGNCDQDFEQFDKMSKDELVFFNQYHEVKAIGKILEGIENRLLQVEKDEAQSDGLIADGVDQSKTPSPFGGCSSESTTPTATTVCPILIRESDMNVATIKLKIESLESQMQYQSKALDIHGDNLKTLKSRCKRIESSFAAGLDAVMTDIDDLKSDYQFPKGLERTRKDLESCKNADDLKKLEGKIHTMVLRQDECNEKRIEIMTQFLEFKKMAYNWLTTEVESLFSGVEMKEAMAKFEERMEFPSEMSDGGAESDGLVDKDVNQSKNGEQHKALDPTNTTSPIESSSSATTTTTCPILDRESDETFENGQCPLEMSGSESAEQDCVDPCKDGKEPKEPESTA